MGFFQKLFKGQEAPAFEAQPMTVLAPMDGRVLPLAQIPDEVFSSGVLGPGCGIEPTGNTVCAPFPGKITQVAETKHAVGLESTDGIEVLIHVGMDTVKMNGAGFTALVKEGSTVKAGTPLLRVDLDAIRAAGYPTTTAVVVTNGDDFSSTELLADGSVASGTPLLKVKA